MTIKKVETPRVESQVKQIRFVKPRLGQAISRRMAEYVEQPNEQVKQVDNRVRGNQRNFNNLISHRLIFNWLKRHVTCVVVTIIFRETVLTTKNLFGIKIKV